MSLFKSLIIASLLILPSVTISGDETKLTEIQKLKAENFQLKVTIGQCQATLADRDNRLKSIELTNEQSVLIEEFRKTLKADEKDKFDWSTLTFTKPTISESK